MRASHVPLSILTSALACACVSEHGPLTNRMAQAATPYLARAAREPVGWQPWGREAFALAARLDRPILLYVGAEGCRWCGMMDREVYGDAALGAMIDSLFVPVRVDRDERPDIADRYAAAVRILAGLRGYPLTVFLTPDGSAFFGGTYFPLDDPVTGRGLKQLLPEVAKSYREQRAGILRRAALVRQLSLGPTGSPHGALNRDVVRLEVDRVRAGLTGAIRSEAALGGFVPAQAAALMLATFGRTGDSAYLAAARAALDRLVDSMDAPAPASLRDDPAQVARAALLRDLAAAWWATGELRYRQRAVDLARGLEAEVARPRAGVAFADRDAYVIGALFDAAAAVGDSLMAPLARAALDTLLKRAYARSRAVRHLAGGGDAGRPLLQDQVQVATACVAAYAAAGDARYLAIAEDLASTLERDFADSVGGGYFDVAAGDPVAPALADRAKPVLDDLLPGANAAAALLLARLSDLTGNPDFRRRADATLEAFAGAVAGQGMRASTYLLAAQGAQAAR